MGLENAVNFRFDMFSLREAGIHFVRKRYIVRRRRAVSAGEAADQGC
ncbi:hypothetical protein SAMN05444158_5619 [Bradyrhizobium canariense]|uniref:Uncharacterized protein n=1 Tax=Bradyrhizobium canariense TaxID=255045 RepID=A0A1H1ZSJ6_9BRAD|nr:hypothetical protein SAMN05444158_5619 [Bradyrhizobium canariense]